MGWRYGLAFFLLCFTIWGSLALFYQVQASVWVRGLVITSYVLLSLFLLYSWVAGHHGGRLLAFGLLNIALLGWWFTIQPTGDKDWAADVQYTTTGQVNGNHVTLEHVRNFVWHNRDQATPQWETRHYDLNQLQTVDMFLSYWMGPAIAHTLVSFGFADGQQVVWSVEIRRQAQQKFSSIGGFFKSFEMSVIAADENDIIRLRTNHRREEVYRYPIDMPLESAQSLFISYVELANDTAQHPRFYHTLFANCTTIVYQLASRIVKGLPKDYRLLLSGYLPSYLQKLGALAGPERPLTVRQHEAEISAKAQAIPPHAPYSEWIRQTDSP